MSAFLTAVQNDKILRFLKSPEQDRGQRMARKHLLESVSGPGVSTQTSETRADYALRGASRSMKLSIEELADNAKRIVSGETILDLDPDLVDPSPVKDRIDDDEEEFALFLESIREKGSINPSWFAHARTSRVATSLSSADAGSGQPGNSDGQFAPS